MTRRRRKPPARDRSKETHVKDVSDGQAGRTAADDPSAKPVPRRLLWVLGLVVSAAVVLGGLAFDHAGRGSRSALPADAPAGSAAFVGSATCADCHRTEFGLWQASQHRHAMDHATDATVLGDFGDAHFDYYGVRSRFFRQDGKFLVETDGADGRLATFEVKYTFGIDPLQQYLVEFPDGRLQALSIAWDSRPRAAGGQRWFHLYAGENIGHADVLHWTRLNQNWNYMCAECHSTGIRKNYDAASDRFATTWAEISVGCEACHGQGSRHVDWAREAQDWWRFGSAADPTKGLLVQFDERNGVAWQADPATGNPHRSVAPALLPKEVETCGLCHARRSAFSEDWVPGQWLSDTHSIAPLAQGLYAADGQMQDEVYNYGSFRQSRMFAAGVTCADCHEPHGAQLRAPGNGVCLQCHASEKYDGAAHRRHETVNPPLACASCHMPARTYMTVDLRHDHSFRIPRPDLSAKLGTPNACTDCHAGKSAAWAAEAIATWPGPRHPGFQNYAEAFHAAWTGRPDAGALLAATIVDSGTPAFARAGALAELGLAAAQAIGPAQGALSDPDPMVRTGALDALENAPAEQLWPLASPLLSDPVRGVRIRAVALLAGLAPDSLPAADRAPFERAAAEFVAAQRLNADRPEARGALGSFFARLGRFDAAEAEFKAALRLNPEYVAAAVNLADVYRALGRDRDGLSVLRAASASQPGDAGVHHALGLTLVRLKQPEPALEELRKAAELAPDQARYAYVYAIALNAAGRTGEALLVLKGNLARHPADRDTLSALIGLSRDAGDVGSALLYAEALARIGPPDPGLAGLIEELRRQVPAPQAP